MKIITKLVLSYVLIIPLIALIGFFAITFSEAALEKEIKAHSSENVSQIINDIDKQVFFHILQTNIISSNEILEKTLQSSNQEFSKIDNIDSLLDQTDKTWISVPDDEITPFMNNLINNDASNFLRETSNFYENEFGYSIYPEIFIANSYGANVAQTGKTSDYKQDDEIWWQMAKQNGSFLQDVEYDQSADVYSIDIAIRIEDANGNFLGVLKNIVNIESIIEIIKNEKANSKFDSVEYELITNDGKMIYSTEPYHTIFDDISSEEYFDDWLKSTTGFSVGIAANDDSQEELFAWSQSSGYKSFPGFGWTLVTEFETSEIFETIIELKFIFIIISGILLLIIPVIGFIISRSIVSPINSLRKATHEIAEGEFNRKILANGSDDIKGLANDVFLMGQKIKEQIRELKQNETQKNEFISMISHELKTPITPIVLYCDMLLKNTVGELNPVQLKTVSTIRSNALSINNLVNDVLDVHKLDLNELKFKFEKLHLNELLNNISNNFENMVKEKQIQFANTTKEEIILMTDSNRLTQVFNNLVKNSIDFVDAKIGTIEINAKYDGNNILFYVKDNGRGIDPKKLKHLFKKFYQTDTSFTRDHGGSGLGLSICKSIVEGLGGKIWVDSSLGKGSTFYFSIPQKKK